MFSSLYKALPNDPVSVSEHDFCKKISNLSMLLYSRASRPDKEYIKDLLKYAKNVETGAIKLKVDPPDAIFFWGNNSISSVVISEILVY